jgi:HD-GYP domain-containing protein (c-di-GMP phosphodiesterase class II)
VELLNILYINDIEAVRDIYVMRLEANYGAFIIEAASASEAVEKLKEEDDISLIISALDLDCEENLEIYHQNLLKSEALPFIQMSNDDLKNTKYYSNFKDDHPANTQITSPVDPKLFKKALVFAGSCIFDRPWTPPQASDHYTHVKMSNFLRLNKIPIDASIKLSDTKYVKVIEREQIYGHEQLERYVEKGVEGLYVFAKEYKILADYTSKALLGLYARKPKNKKDAIKLQLASLEDVHTRMNDEGLTKEAVALTKKTMEASVAQVKSTPGIWQLINKMEANKGYIYDHSLKVSFVSIAIAKKSEWNSDGTCYKLSLAALMHDMCLTDHELAKIQRLEEIEEGRWSEDDLEVYRNHGLEAGKLIKGNKQLPADVDFIVEQHHERPDSNGFPRGISKNFIAPLACLFILAHEFVHRVSDMDGEFSPENCQVVIDQLANEDYNKGNFKKPFQGLINAFTPKEDHIKKRR